MKCQSMWNQGQNLPRVKAGLSLQCQDKKKLKVRGPKFQFNVKRKTGSKSQRINVKVSIQCQDINIVESHREPIWRQMLKYQFNAKTKNSLKSHREPFWRQMFKYQFNTKTKTRLKVIEDIFYVKRV